MHLVVSIAGLEKRLLHRVSKKYGSWEILSDDTGRMLTKAEVWAEIERCKKLGYDVIPTCDIIDDRGHCKGHELKTVEIWRHGILEKTKEMTDEEIKKASNTDDYYINVL